MVTKLIEELFEVWGDELVIISGGARGIDTFAEQAARSLGVACLVIRPEPFPRNAGKARVAQAFYDRNLKIVMESEVVHAYVARDRRGGTENTIKHAEKEKKQVVIHLPVPEV